MIHIYIVEQLPRSRQLTHASPHIVNFLCVERMFKIYSSNFQLYNTALLTIVTMLYIRSSELVLVIAKFVSFDLHPPSPIFTEIFYHGYFCALLLRM